MNEILSMLIEGMVKAFGVMKSFEIVDGVNLLSLFLALLVIRVLLKIVLVSHNGKEGKSD